MTKLQSVLTYLGHPYSTNTIDGEDIIYRKLSNNYEFEVSGIHGNSRDCTIYVWDELQRIVGVYSKVQYPETLKDFLGYLAVKYQNLTSEILAEREDQTE